MQILIIGKSANANALAQKIKETQPEDIIFIAPGNQAVGAFATCIDIQPNNIDELVDFAQANEINITIICDDEAIEEGITDAFNEAGLMVFGPEKESARFATSKAVGKRFMYKLKMPTPKFGIFDKESSAREYIKNATYPIFIKSERHEAGENNHLCLSEREANNILNKLFSIDSPKVIIENYISGREFSFYAVTDGYNALPICSVVPYKYSSEKDGGSITKGVGAYAPASFADEEITCQILDTVIYPALNEIEKNASPYVGIIGVDLILDNNNNLQVIEFNTFFNEPDAECILELLNENIVQVFRACTVGSLADDYDYLEINNKSAVSVLLTKTPKYLFDNEQSEVTGLQELEDEIKVTLYNSINKNNIIKAKAGRVLSLTSTGSTLSQAKNKLAQWIDCVNFDGKKYRKDILGSTYER